MFSAWRKFSLAKSELREEIMVAPPPCTEIWITPNLNLTCHVTSITCRLFHQAGGLSLKDMTGRKAVQG